MPTRQAGAERRLLGLLSHPHASPAELAEVAVVAQPPRPDCRCGRSARRGLDVGADRKVPLDHHQGGQLLTDLLGQLGVTLGVLLDARPLAGPVAARNDSATSSKGSRSMVGSLMLRSQ